MKEITEQRYSLRSKIHPLSVINKIFYIEKGGFKETEQGRGEKEDQMQLPYERILICTFLFFLIFYFSVLAAAILL